MADREPSRGGALAALALATLLGMSTWFSGTAVIGALRTEWRLSARSPSSGCARCPKRRGWREAEAESSLATRYAVRASRRPAQAVRS